jgi:hypothetical protein
MRPILLVIACFALGLCAYLGAGDTGKAVKVCLRLIDGKTGKEMAGLVRIAQDGEKLPLSLPGLFDRRRGLERGDTPPGWYVVPAGGAETTLPRARLRLEALSGLETALARQELDLTGTAPREVVVKLDYLFRPEEYGLAAGNTHLHLRNLSREQSDEYLRRIPAADGLKVMFISYLERFKDDRDYITNQYRIGELKELSGAGVLFSNGEEHRHNFSGYGQGYGHVMFLGIRELVKPVSLGPGITGGGNDDRPLRPGLDEARRQGGTVIWCHNASGHEDVPSALAGRLDALNVFDGSRSGSYEDTYYRFLNIGLRLPISTGTDWFLYDFARVYTRITGPLSVAGWLDALRAGRSIATNGPLVQLSVDGRPIGDTLSLDGPRTVRVEAKAIGRHDFQKLQLVHNGKVVHAEPAAAKDGRYTASFVREMKVDSPGWLAVRIESRSRNELDRVLFAHSSPVWIDLNGRRIFDVESARALLRQIEEAQADIRARGLFSSKETAARVNALYEDAAALLRRRMAERGK